MIKNIFNLFENYLTHITSRQNFIYNHIFKNQEKFYINFNEKDLILRKVSILTVNKLFMEEMSFGDITNRFNKNYMEVKKIINNFEKEEFNKDLNYDTKFRPYESENSPKLNFDHLVKSKFVEVNLPVESFSIFRSIFHIKHIKKMITNYIIKENAHNDILDYVTCHPNNENFDLMFKFYQKYNSRKFVIEDPDNFKKLKKLINSNLDKFNLVNLSNLYNLIEVNKSFKFRFKFLSSEIFKILNLHSVDKINLEEKFLEKIKLLNLNGNNSTLHTKKKLNIKDATDMINYSNVSQSKEMWQILKINFKRNIKEITASEMFIIISLLSTQEIGSKYLFQNLIEILKKKITQELIKEDLKVFNLKFNKDQTVNTETNSEIKILLRKILYFFIFNISEIQKINLYDEKHKIFMTVLKEFLQYKKDDDYNEIDLILNKNKLMKCKKINNSSLSIYGYLIICKLHNYQNLQNQPDSNFIKNLIRNYKFLNQITITKLNINYYSQINLHLLSQLSKLLLRIKKVVNYDKNVHRQTNILIEYIIKKLTENIKFYYESHKTDKENKHTLHKLKMFIIHSFSEIYIEELDTEISSTITKNNFLNLTKEIILELFINPKDQSHLRRVNKVLHKYDKDYKSKLDEALTWNEIINLNL